MQERGKSAGPAVDERRRRPLREGCQPACMPAASFSKGLQCVSTVSRSHCCSRSSFCPFLLLFVTHPLGCRRNGEGGRPWLGWQPKRRGACEDLGICV